MKQRAKNRNRNIIIKLVLINILITLALLSVNIIDLFKKEEVCYNYDSKYYYYNIIYNIQESDKIDEMFYESEFIVTAYCGCEKCCGKSDGITASGSIAKENHTIAVDTDVIPFGTLVEIDGTYYVAEDTGGLIDGNRIDIYFESHQEALEFGEKTIKVKIFKKIS